MSSTIPSPDTDSSGFWLPPTPPQDRVSSATAGATLAAHCHDSRLDESEDVLVSMPVELMSGTQSGYTG